MAPFRQVPPRRPPNPYRQVQPSNPFRQIGPVAQPTRALGGSVPYASLYDLPQQTYNMGLPPGVDPNSLNIPGLNLPQAQTNLDGSPMGSIQPPPRPVNPHTAPETDELNGYTGPYNIDQGAHLNLGALIAAIQNEGMVGQHGFKGTGARPINSHSIDINDALSRANDWRNQIHVMAHNLAPGATLARARSEFQDFGHNQRGPAESAFNHLAHVSDVHTASRNLAQALSHVRPSRAFRAAPSRRAV